MSPGAPPAPAQERRAPTIQMSIGAALLPTGSGPAPTRLLSYDAGADTTLSWSHDGGRTGKEINVSGVPASVQKSVFKFPQHRTREWGHCCPSSIL